MIYINIPWRLNVFQFIFSVALKQQQFPSSTPVNLQLESIEKNGGAALSFSMKSP